jgi:hypothetical protein
MANLPNGKVSGFMFKNIIVVNFQIKNPNTKSIAKKISFLCAKESFPKKTPIDISGNCVCLSAQI